MIAVIKDVFGNDRPVNKKHPLEGTYKPGPRSKDLIDPDGLEEATKIFDLIASGGIHTHETPLKNYSKQKRLTVEDERELSYRFHTFGDLDARNILIVKNIGLIYMVASQHQTFEFPVDDLFPYGVFGLMRAIERFDPDRGIRFSTFAVYWVRAKIQRYKQSNDKNAYQKIEGKSTRVRSLQESTSLGEDAIELGEAIASDQDTEDDVIKQETTQKVREAANQVMMEMNDPRVNVLFKERLLADEPKTLHSVGLLIGLSREGVRLIEKVVAQRMRELLAMYK